jgi:hypothetical protein
MMRERRPEKRGNEMRVCACEAEASTRRGNARSVATVDLGGRVGVCLFEESIDRFFENDFVNPHRRHPSFQM